VRLLSGIEEVIDEPAPSSRRTAALDCLLIVAVFAIPLLILRPLQDAPFVDDWVYNSSVKHFLATGQLLIPQYSSSVNPVQVLIGALFCLPAHGFSFVATRLSTWALGASGLCAVYLLCREFELPRAQSLLAAAVLGFCPLYFLLSMTFMTDVGFVALATWSMWATVRAIRRHGDGWLIASTIFAILSSGFRLPAVVLPIAASLAMVGQRDRWTLRWWRLLVVLSPLAFVGMLLVWNTKHQFVSVDLSGIDNSPARRVENLKHYALPLLRVMVPRSVLFLAGTGGLCLLPLALAGIRFSRQFWIRCGVVFVVVIAVHLVLRAWHEGLSLPLSAGSMWRLDELGASTDLAPGALMMHASTGHFATTLFVPLLLVGSIILGRIVFAPAQRGESVLRWTVVGHLALGAILWLFYDRYILPILPAMIVMTVIAQPRFRTGIAVCGVVFFASFSIVGVRDHLAYSRTLWSTVRQLYVDGIAPRDIDAGYVVNGWFQYCIPENTPLDSTGKPYVPWLTDKGNLPYVVSSAPLPGYTIVAKQPVHRILGPDLTIYTLQRFQK
jgi:hypothetical protein